MTTYLVAYAFIVPLFIWDITSLGRIHRATLCGGLGIVLSLPIRMWLSDTWLIYGALGCSSR